MADAVTHVHEWQPAGIVQENRMLHSPVSHNDHDHYTVDILIRSCPCGAVQRQVVAERPVRDG